MVVEIIIVQHGEKKQDGNDPGLTALGRRQANVTARFIADKFNIGAIVSSPLKRARETAEVISDELGISVNIDGRFRERMNWDPAITGQSLEEFLVDWDRASRDREYVPISGDSSRQAGNRFRQAIIEYSMLLSGDQALVVVAHGGVTIDLLRDIVGDDLLERTQPGLIERGISGCAISRLNWREGTFKLVGLPNPGHLENELQSSHVAN